ncbi:ABC transporter substrate-binding protein [Mesorhizobium sp. SARCC-RB16n]|uniref:ABC transporter substrate-binding protein n=1 Tax=Mesorhizobium sp. SARCC-RB16n TaxID=2116687 RepID=UPI00122F8BFA|nr:ABC transporter substrate-binding protein [Mesorhizobium sp. SARCC-RB16n]KAA3447267.1 ABC transporter substrate-binding protein [Mesorhizobium sp. SARCC-RB16n]
MDHQFLPKKGAEFVKLKSIVVACSLLAVLPTIASADEPITFASWGGTIQDAMRKAFWEPISQKLGVSFKEDTGASLGIAGIRAQVQSGAVLWDLVDLAVPDCAAGAAEGLFEPLDYAVINTDGIDPRFANKYWIAGPWSTGSYMAWRKGLFAGDPPRTYADFWNVKKYPGRRALYDAPQETLEVAQLADGVAIDKLYPIDMDKALAKLREIKSYITIWYTGGQQQIDLVRKGEVDLLYGWSPRLDILYKEGLIDRSLDQAFLAPQCLVVPKGAKNKALAMKFIAAMLTPEVQKTIPNFTTAVPINQKVFSENMLAPERVKDMPTMPDAAGFALKNAQYWSTPGILSKAQETWDAFKQE